MENVTDVQKVVEELVAVLVSNEVPMVSLDTVLDSLKDEVYSNTVIQKVTAQEVPVQEQYEYKCKNCGRDNKITLPSYIKPKFCMNCGSSIFYQKSHSI